MRISKAQWVKIEEKLKEHFGCVKFQYQDTEVCVIRTYAGEGKTKLTVYLNDQICAGWGWTSCDVFNPLVEFFWSKRSTSIYKPKQVREFEKIFGKRGAKKEVPNLHKKITWYHPCFSKASALVRQFKRIEGLSLITESQGDSL
ncbi:hypothetical protein GKR70_12225 [Providencia alcalifaciens]|uniref:hypothetical protein n=1 Tax=Providencia alcalifaciens TaxID=126385 RepID=UPI0012B62362|nr:hypothetical protein [Providencia alcalifaciens]MTC39269.1 hypothetical protein [Providencia alcalifaciens]